MRNTWFRRFVMHLTWKFLFFLSLFLLLQFVDLMATKHGSRFRVKLDFDDFPLIKRNFAANFGNYNFHWFSGVNFDEHFHDNVFARVELTARGWRRKFPPSDYLFPVELSKSNFHLWVCLRRHGSKSFGHDSGGLIISLEFLHLIWVISCPRQLIKR